MLMLTALKRWNEKFHNMLHLRVAASKNNSYLLPNETILNVNCVGVSLMSTNKVFPSLLVHLKENKKVVKIDVLRKEMS